MLSYKELSKLDNINSFSIEGPTTYKMQSNEDLKRIRCESYKIMSPGEER